MENLTLLRHHALVAAVVGCGTSLTQTLGLLLGSRWQCVAPCETEHPTLEHAEALLESLRMVSPDVILVGLGPADARRRADTHSYALPLSQFQERLATLLTQFTLMGRAVFWLTCSCRGGLPDPDSMFTPRGPRLASPLTELPADENGLLPLRAGDHTLFQSVAQDVCWRLGVETIDLAGLATRMNDCALQLSAGDCSDSTRSATAAAPNEAAAVTDWAPPIPNSKTDLPEEAAATPKPASDTAAQVRQAAQAAFIAGRLCALQQPLQYPTGWLTPAGIARWSIEHVWRRRQLIVNAGTFAAVAFVLYRWGRSQPRVNPAVDVAAKVAIDGAKR
jgi:hypothetical protein